MGYMQGNSAFTARPSNSIAYFIGLLSSSSRKDAFWGRLSSSATPRFECNEWSLSLDCSSSLKVYFAFDAEKKNKYLI